MTGVDLQELMSRPLGPLPIGAWTFITVAGVVIIAKLSKGGTTPNSSADGGNTQNSGQFSSSMSRTNPITGEKVDYTANGPNSSIMTPAQMVWGAGPMGYQTGGDVYVNLPAETEINPTPIINISDNDHAPIPAPPPPAPLPISSVPLTPPPPLPPPPPPPAGQWYTFKNGDTLWNLSQRFYGAASYNNWHKIWNDPRNSWLVRSTGGTTDWRDQGHYHIPGGSRIWVPA